MIRTERLELVPWDDAHVDAVVRIADSYRVWLNLRDTFPHPYTAEDARGWVAFNRELEGPTQNFALLRDGELVGGAGVEPLEDVQRIGGEIGYWLGEPYWGHGYATEAVRALTEYAFSEMDLMRCEAGVFGYNLASVRVLEKAGYAHEGTLRRAVLKDGRITDRLLYAKLREE